MAVLRAVKNQKQTSGSMLGVMVYMADKNKTTYENIRLTTGLNCNFNISFTEMQLTKEQFKKTDKRQFYQFVQSFAEDDKVTPLEVHEMGLELAQELFPQFEVIVATHTNTENLHNHILVNSVSFDTGKKLHQNHDTFVQQRLKNDELCVRHGLAILPQYQKMKRGTAISSAEYNAAKRGKSWKFRLMATIDDCMKFAKNKKMFIDLMESEGYKINWTDERKYITYITQKGNKCRDKSLHENKYMKENMENEFRIREEKSFARVETIEQTRTFAEDTAELQRGNTVSDGHYSGAFEIPEQVDENLFSIAGADVETDERDATQIFTGGTKQETGEHSQPTDTEEQDPITGWEEERESLFNPKTQTTEDRNFSTYNDFDNGNIADIGSDLVQIGVNLERLGNSEPVIDSTTQPTTKISRKHRIGDKEDEHRHGFEMKM